MAQPDDSSDPLIGLVLRGYKVDELLNRGKASALYKATQLSVARPVALKVLDPELARKRETLAAFVREARSAGKLRHPGVVEIHEVCQEGKYIFYSMEFLPGGSLGELVHRHGPLPWARVLPMLSSAADALLYAEQRKIVHGSLNPGHLLFTKDDRLKVLNLGFAGPPSRKLETTERQPLLRAAARNAPSETSPHDPPLQPVPAEKFREKTLFRIAFLAPEQLQDGVQDHLTDIYSLACTFQFALIGRLPFTARTSREMLEAKLRGSVAPGPSAGSRLQRERASPAEPEAIPDWAGSLLAAMMAPDPRERCPSFQVVLEVLESRGKVSPRSRPRKPDAGVKPAAPGPLATAFKRVPRTKLAVALGGLLIVAAVILACFVLPGSPKAPSKGGVPSGLADRVKEISEGWESRRLGASDAIAALESLILEHPDPEARALVELHLEAVREAARKTEESQARERLERLEKEIAAAGEDVAQGRFGQAITRLAALEVSFPERSAALKQDLDAVHAAAKMELERVGEECEELVRSGEFVKAISSLEALSSRLPASLLESVKERISRWKEARDAAAEGLLAKAERAARARLADLDFEGGLKVLADLPEIALPEASARKTGLKEMLEQSRKLWELLRSVPLPEWKDLAPSFKESRPGGPEIESFQRFKSALLETAVKLYAAKYQGQARESWFHGRAEFEGELTLKLSYDFSRKDQLEDLVSVGGRADSISIKDGKLSLHGEYRLLEGNPFRDRLSVSFTAVELQRDAPNINVAFWTHEEDRVTHRGGEAHEPATAEPGEQKPGRAGYLVFGLGYQPENALSTSLKAPEGGLPILFPCMALIHQPHGMRLHGDLRWSCLWGESILQPLKRSQEVTIRVQPGSVEWSLGKESLAARLSPGARAALQGILVPGSVGTVTIFSNGQTLTLSSLKVLGDLDPAWVEGKLRARALKDLEEKVPRIPWTDLEAGK
jgi:serine/threonine protein kinase